MNMLAEVADRLSKSQQTVVFTGAGISTESGIPDFRSPGGVWTKYRTVEYGEFMSSVDGRLEYWRQKCEAHREFADSKPNLGHQVLAKWEQQGKLHGVVTQNIDELHQLAGNQNVLELHGTARRIKCQDCGFMDNADAYVDAFLANQELPTCPTCGQDRLKHATVSFGQSLPADALYKAFDWAKSCDVILSLGSSLVVTPAADIPRTAKRHGATLIIINRDPTPLDSMANYVIHEPLGETLAAIDAALTERM
ncbi:MAG: NAD-dependent deacylase [Pirellulaceae bacterium]